MVKILVCINFRAYKTINWIYIFNDNKQKYPYYKKNYLLFLNQLINVFVPTNKIIFLKHWVQVQLTVQFITPSFIFLRDYETLCGGEYTPKIIVYTLIQLCRMINKNKIVQNCMLINKYVRLSALSSAATLKKLVSLKL